MGSAADAVVHVANVLISLCQPIDLDLRHLIAHHVAHVDPTVACLRRRWVAARCEEGDQRAYEASRRCSKLHPRSDHATQLGAPLNPCYDSRARVGEKK
jgi:hypothetical protein